MIVVILTLFAIAASFLVFRVDGSLLLKTIAALCLFATASITYFSLEDFKGWPSTQELPTRGSVVGIDAVEPDESSEGSIFLWVKVNPDDVEYSFFKPDDVRSPRSYRIPYTEGNSQAADQMKKALMNGLLVELNGKGKGSSLSGQHDTEGKGEGEASGFYLEGTQSGAEITNPSVTNPK
jgi:hypothetical protein